MTAAEIEALRKLLAEAVAANENTPPLSDNSRVDDGVPPTKEEPMYSWISPKSYDHHGRRKVIYRDLQGKRHSIHFPNEIEARKWTADAQKLLVADGRPAEKVLDAYLAALPTLNRRPPKASTLTTIRYRLAGFFAGRERVSVESFPWTRAWGEKIAVQKGASQVGVLAALRGLVKWAGLPQKVLADCRITQAVNHGKTQLHIDEARRFVAAALTAGDSLAMAAATMVVVGCRPGEVLELRSRDVDDGGNLLHVYGTKTKAATRPVPVDPAFVPVLLGLASGRASDELLFPWEPDRVRRSKDASKAKRDALLRRVRSLCKTAQVREVVPHSLRGLNATLRKTGGASDDSITRALGHVSIETTKRSYFAPGAAETADARRAFGRLLQAA